MLRALETRGPATVAAVAEATGLHENTVRGHLARLEADGYAAHDPAAPVGGRGRPTSTWRAVTPGTLGPYAGLAAALADALSHAQPDRAAALARDAGMRWGEELAAASAQPENARAAILTAMREQGFAPEETDDGNISLTRCPLLAVAAQRSDIVCAVHAGMLAGIAGGSGGGTGTGTGTGPTLLPFATPDTCVVRLKLAS